MERPIGPALLEEVSWDNLRFLLVIARTLSFRKAATALRTSTPTVIRRIERLESDLRTRVFDRLPDGLRLTEQGKGIYQVAQEMERRSFLLRAYSDQNLHVRGIVRCSVTEGLGTYWVLPHLVRFSRTYPATVVDLRCAMEVADVMRMEADVAVQLDKPRRLDAKSVRLARLHVYPFASRQYVDTYGLPKTRDEIKHHRVIHQKAPQVEEDAFARMLDLESIEGIIGLRTSTSTALACAIELGLGIGPLPTYVAALGSDLLPVDIGIRYHVDVWMTYHPDARRSRRVSLFMDWLKTVFDSKRYPWFGNDFIHPRDLSGVKLPDEGLPNVLGSALGRYPVLPKTAGE
jgi:DNA-binding transcriptional LysR family regulator